jgi:hypothetical protein
MAIFAGIALMAGLAVLVLAASPLVAAIGKLTIALAVIGSAATATMYLMDQATAALAFHNEDFHWY